MAKVLGFEQRANYMDKEKMEKMLSGEEGAELLKLAGNISAALHEDWKENLVREKGTEYQHFRDVKDEERKQEILANKEEINQVEELLKTDPSAITAEQRKKYLSEDGKLLYRIETQKKKVMGEDGEEKEVDVEVAMFDLMRVPFVELTKRWQDANLDAAKFALCLVKEVLDQGKLKGSPEEIFKVFEEMSHDVHLFWMVENMWADPDLLRPYEYLKVDTPGYNEKDKDRDKINKTTVALTNQSNLPERNRSIVVRAVIELMNNHAVSTGLDPKVLESLHSIIPHIKKQNEIDYTRYLKNKNKVQDTAQRVLKDKDEMLFSDLEILARTYFEDWKKEYLQSIGLPDDVNVPYDQIPVEDERINHKNIARKEVLQILMELQKEGKLIVPPPEKAMKKKIADSNKKDHAKYLETQRLLAEENVKNETEPGE